MKRRRGTLPIIAAGLAIALGAGSSALASSHREAPFITKMPKVDGTDLYMFRSYEENREGFVTVLANYIPLQDPYGGPNYFFLDPDAMYEIHIDNNGDAVEDITFQFRPQIDFQSLAIPVGPEGDQRTNNVPVYNIGPVENVDDADLNIREDYTVTVVRGDRRTGTATSVQNLDTGNNTFDKAADYVGTKSFPDYEAYAQQHIYNINVPGCEHTGGRVFVGQRDEPFVVALGEIFDLINVPPGDVTGQNPGCQDPLNDDLDGKNITTFALEVPIGCLTQGEGADPVIGAWTTASVRQARVVNPSPDGFDDAAVYGGPWAQVSRLGNPLVNEVVIGLGDKNAFNASEPSNDAQFLDYVTHPVLPELVEIIFADAAPLAPNVFPRNDLVNVFLLGVEGLNRPEGVVPSEQLRLNTSIPPIPVESQNPLGVLGGDNAGFPNGRRPGDDVVDIELRVLMGALLPEDAMSNPAGSLPFTDCAPTHPADCLGVFPYLMTPIPGSAAE